jgi:hypothetical protein
LNEIVTAGNCPIWLIESDSLVGTNFVNALSGTGVDDAVLLVLLPPPPPPPPLPLLDELPVDVGRDVPDVEVVALDDVPVFVLVVDSTVEFAPAVDPVDSAELEFTLPVADPLLVFPDASADVVDAVEPTPLAAVGVSFDVVAAPLPDPAPDDDPCVADAPAATVPVVVACT